MPLPEAVLEVFAVTSHDEVGVDLFLRFVLLQVRFGVGRLGFECVFVGLLRSGVICKNDHAVIQDGGDTHHSLRPFLPRFDAIHIITKSVQSLDLIIDGLIIRTDLDSQRHQRFVLVALLIIQFVDGAATTLIDGLTNHVAVLENRPKQVFLLDAYHVLKSVVPDFFSTASLVFCSADIFHSIHR